MCVGASAFVVRRCYARKGEKKSKYLRIVIIRLAAGAQQFGSVAVRG